MRFEELAYTVDGLSITVPFHAGLTVVNLPGGEKRAAWVARLLGVLEGIRPGDGASVVCLDHAGRRIRLERDDQGGATLTDLATGAELPYSAGHLRLDGRLDWFASIGITSRAASDLIVVDHEAFTGDEEYDSHEVEAELKDARKLVTRVEGQRRAAMARSRRRDDLRRDISELDERIRALLERAEAEAVLAAVGAADEWRRAVDTVDDARRLFGPRVRLDGDSLTRALARPTEVASGFESLAAACRAAAERRDELVARLGPLRDAELDSKCEILRELIDDVEPAYVDALVALASACRPFGVSIDASRIETAGLAADGIVTIGIEALAEVAARAAEATDARLQQALDDAELQRRAAQEQLQRHLASFGLPADGTDDFLAGAEAVTGRAAGAASVLATPLDSRPLAQVEAERSRLIQELRRIERGLPDVAQLAERHSGLERRVAVLEASFRAGRPVVTIQEAEIVLLRRAAHTRRVGRHREPLPLVMNDALAALVPSDKWALLDVVVRLGETTQVVYLTDDVDTLAWASGQAGTCEIIEQRPDGFATVA
jgi:hypothetical protein